MLPYVCNSFFCTLVYLLERGSNLIVLGEILIFDTSWLCGRLLAQVIHSLFPFRRQYFQHFMDVFDFALTVFCDTRWSKGLKSC